MDDGLRKSFAWGVPYIINGHDTEGTLATTLRPFQPDVCLAVRKRGGGKEAPFHLTAINYTVYAAFFAYFPRRFNIAPSSHIAEAIASGDDSAMSTYEELPHADDMEAIHEVDDVHDDDNDDDDDDDGDDDYYSSVSGASAIAALEIGEYLHLPVLAIELPDPATMELIHERLHHPFTKWQPALLGLNLHQAMTPEAAKNYLAQRSFPEVVKILAKIQGVWKNISALGLENEAMWRELASAYNIVISVLLGRVHNQPPSNA